MNIINQIKRYFKKTEEENNILGYYSDALKTSQKMRDAFGSRPPIIECKSPREIDILYRSFKTRRENLRKSLDDDCAKSFEDGYALTLQIRKLNIKIELLEVLLKLKKK